MARRLREAFSRPCRSCAQEPGDIGSRPLVTRASPDATFANAEIECDRADAGCDGGEASNPQWPIHMAGDVPRGRVITPGRDEDVDCSSAVKVTDRTPFQFVT